MVNEGEHSETEEDWESEKKEMVAKIQVQRIKETCPALRVHKKGISQSYLYPYLCYNRLMVTHKQSE